MIRNIVLLGFCVGDRYFERFSRDDPFPQVAAYKLESRILEALGVAGVHVSTVASIAVSTFPKHARIWFPFSVVDREGGAKGIVLPLINLPGLKMCVRFLGALYGLVRMGWSADGLLVYAAHSPNLLAAFLYSKFFAKPYYVYVPDLPSYMDMGLKVSWLRRCLKRVDSVLLDWLLCSSSGLLVVSKAMVEDNVSWSRKPFMVLEGVSDNCPLARKGEVSVRGPIFYSGGVNKAYGIVELVEGYLSSGVSCDLVICGRGDLEAYLKDMSMRHASIKYLGYVSPSHVAELQSGASLLVLTRDPAQSYTRYSFPSKLLEYVAAGIPVLSTRLEGIPVEYFDYINIIDGFSSDKVADALVDFFSGSQDSFWARAERGKIWALDTKSINTVGKRLVEFMEKFK